MITREQQYENIVSMYRDEGWGKITDKALRISPSDVESQARSVARWAHTEIEGKDRRIRELLEANNRFEQDGRNWRIVEKLRADEGHSVLIINDNPDFNGQGALVECVGDWTGWEVEKFTGDNIDQALGAALVAFNKRRSENA